MLEKIAQLAEQAATNASRRQFFGRVANGSLALAAVLGSLLVFPTVTAAGPGRIPKCCFYECTRADGSTYGLTQQQPCGKQIVNDEGDPCVLTGKGPCGR